MRLFVLFLLICAAAAGAVNYGDVPANTALARTRFVSGAALGKGVTAPTDVLLGTSPEAPALLFDATAETAATFVEMPDDWDQGDVTLVVVWSLVGAETDADTLSLTLDYVATIPNSTGNGPTKTSTQILMTQDVTTANGLAANDVYELSQLLNAGDATNPLANANALVMEIRLTNLTEIASIHVLGVQVEYEATR